MDWFPLWLSLRVAVLATVLTVTAGVPVAWLLARRRFPGRDLLGAAPRAVDAQPSRPIREEETSEERLGMDEGPLLGPAEEVQS